MFEMMHITIYLHVVLKYASSKVNRFHFVLSTRFSSLELLVAKPILCDPAYVPFHDSPRTVKTSVNSTINIKP